MLLAADAASNRRQSGRPWSRRSVPCSPIPRREQRSPPSCEPPPLIPANLVSRSLASISLPLTFLPLPLPSAPLNKSLHCGSPTHRHPSPPNISPIHHPQPQRLPNHRQTPIPQRHGQAPQRLLKLRTPQYFSEDVLFLVGGEGFDGCLCCRRRGVRVAGAGVGGGLLGEEEELRGEEGAEGVCLGGGEGRKPGDCGGGC